MNQNGLIHPPSATDIDFSFWMTLPGGKVEKTQPEKADTLLIVTDAEQAGLSFVESFAALYGRKVTGENIGPAWRLAP